MKFSKVAIAAAAVLGSFAAHAQAADMEVTGSITPGACTMSITGGAVNHGALSEGQFAALNSGTIYQAADYSTHKLYAQHARTIEVLCPAAATIAIAVTDANDANNTSNSGLPALVNTAQGNAYVGLFGMWQMPNGTMDGVPVATQLTSVGVSGAPTWAAGGGWLRKGYSYGYSVNAGATAPSAAAMYTLPLNVATFVRPDLVAAQIATGAVNFAGRATLTMRSI